MNFQRDPKEWFWFNGNSKSQESFGFQKDYYGESHKKSVDISPCQIKENEIPWYIQKWKGPQKKIQHISRKNVGISSLWWIFVYFSSIYPFYAEI